MKNDFLKGTYGWDYFSKTLILLSIPFLIFRPTIFIGIGIAIYAFYRRFSRNVYRRQMEERAFEDFMRKLNYKINGLKQKRIFESLKYKLNSLKYKMKQRKQYVIVKCPNCSQKLRLPRHKGNLIVTCKKCSHEFKKRT
ncbi:hypothetical protein ACFIJ5_13395 [Haloimpatiens sp. FM7330]|uniref:hypothetical protein n=1 Tax=Haloimpatiens sp. FM7330 TaxID=3298610 RepID=UPI00363D223F